MMFFSQKVIYPWLISLFSLVLPILLLVGYDMIRRRQYEKANKQDTDALMKELEELRRLKAEKEKQEQL